MGNLYLVRHGQASFGAADYDNLSELGHKQSVKLGEHFRDTGVTFDAVITGTLKRHVQTWQGIAQGMQRDDGDALAWPGLNEYDPAAIIHAIHPEPLQKATTPEQVKSHFRLLRTGLAAWMQGKTEPIGMPKYADFLGGVTSALDHVRANHFGKNVLIVSSGGPISTAVGHVLGASPEATIELNLRIKNSALSEFAFNPKRHVLVSYNTVPHLSSKADSEWVTYA
ncbi:MAG: histidine phosphatase family protein [Rhizobacter sp.]|nr:histidine phosphatase family protein [Burkholderiales bacterium]